MFYSHYHTVCSDCGNGHAEAQVKAEDSSRRSVTDIIADIVIDVVTDKREHAVTMPCYTT